MSTVVEEDELLVEVVVEVPVGVDVRVLVVVEVPVGVVVVLVLPPVVGTTIASPEELYCAIAGELPNNTDNARLLRNTNLKGLDDINHPPVKIERELLICSDEDFC